MSHVSLPLTIKRDNGDLKLKNIKKKKLKNQGFVECVAKL